MDDLHLLYVTAASEKEAEAIAEALVEERLGACATFFPVRSVYRWEGKVQRDRETVVLIKTRAGLVDAAMARIAKLHSYRVPCILALPVEAANAAYAAWLGEATREGAAPSSG